MFAVKRLGYGVAHELRSRGCWSCVWPYLHFAMTHALHAIGPLDGRYRGRLQGVADYFSEYAYIKHRVEVEIEYFINLLQLDPPLPQLSGLLAKLRSV